MKKLTKRLLAVVLCVAVLAGITVLAADIVDDLKTPTITFDASTKKFTIKHVDMTEELVEVDSTGAQVNKYPILFQMENLMPGDNETQTIKVRVKNAGSNTVKMYLKAETSEDYAYHPTDLAYDELVAGGLNLTVKFEGKTYTDRLVQKGAVSGTAKDATEPSAEGVYLGAYTGSASEKTMDVTLDFPITAGNDLQGKVAHLGWVITAEIISGGGGGGGGGIEIPDEPIPGGPLELTEHFAYIIGRRDGLIHPEAQITRGEVATIFFRMLTDDTRNALWSTTNTYTDVPSTLWCNNAISTLTNGGILKGYMDGSFRAGEPITRAEFATMAVRFFQVTYDGPDLFSDISGHWAKDYINRAAAAGIILGYQDGTFRPDQDITRAQAIVIINRVLQRHPDKDHLMDDMITWPDNMDTNAWYYADVQEATNSHDYDIDINSEGEEYEIWTELQPVRDWAAFETEWATANSASNPGNVYSSSNSMNN